MTETLAEVGTSVATTRVGAKKPRRRRAERTPIWAAGLTRDDLQELLVARLRYDAETGELYWTAGEEEGQRADTCFTLGYRVVNFAWRPFRAHRLAWRIVTGNWPKVFIDHINGDRADNRWSNLREADYSVNAQNQHRPMRTNSTGYLGVMFDKRRKSRPFRAAIRVKGKHISLGWYDSPREAYEAYLKAKAQVHPGCSLPVKEGLCQAQ